MGVEEDSFDGICNSLFGSYGISGKETTLSSLQSILVLKYLYFIHMKNGQVVKRQ